MKIYQTQEFLVVCPSFLYVRLRQPPWFLKQCGQETFGQKLLS